jgi:hypothetical protein
MRELAQDILTKIYELTNAQEGDREKLQGIAAILTEHLAVREGDDALILEALEFKRRMLCVLDKQAHKEGTEQWLADKSAQLDALALRFAARAARERKLRDRLVDTTNALEVMEQAGIFGNADHPIDICGCQWCMISSLTANARQALKDSQ